MFSSIRAAAAALPPWAEAFFVLPADIPLVRATTIAAMIDIWRTRGTPLLYPTFEGRRGHPPLLAAAWAGRIQVYSGADGLRGLLQTREADAGEVPVADAGILFDMDTPEDYRRACSRTAKADVPTAAECTALMNLRFGDGAPVIEHCRTVARIALRLTAALERTGCPLDADLVQAASLVHDVAKGAPDHAAAGERLLRSLGFARVGAIVGEHMNLSDPAQITISEKEVVNLADKLARDDGPVDLDTRFADKLRRHGSDPAVRAAIIRRRDQAQAVQAAIEARLGHSLQTVFERSEQ
jgi:hypothetical protein